MPILNRKSALAAAAAIFLAAPAALAEVHDIIIFDDNYYPTTFYVNTGDELDFTNAGLDAHEVVGADEAWTSGPIGADGSLSSKVSPDMPQTFRRATGGECEALAGFEDTLSYDEPSLSD